MISSVHIYTQKRWICLNYSLSFSLTPVTTEFYLLSNCISVVWLVISTLLNTMVISQPSIDWTHQEYFIFYFFIFLSIRSILNSLFLLCIGNYFLILFPDYYTVLMILWSLFFSFFCWDFLFLSYPSSFFKTVDHSLLKSLLNLLLFFFFLFSVLVFGIEACEILATWPGVERAHPLQ